MLSPPCQARGGIWIACVCGRNYGANAAFHQHQIQPEFKIITTARAGRLRKMNAANSE